MQDLRNHLFETLEKLKDDEKPMEVERSKAICGVAHQLIESAKVEVKFMEVHGDAVASDFFDKTQQNRLQLAGMKPVARA
jgi:hypothetical protein